MPGSSPSVALLDFPLCHRKSNDIAGPEILPLKTQFQPAELLLQEKNVTGHAVASLSPEPTERPIFLSLRSI